MTINFPTIKAKKQDKKNLAHPVPEQCIFFTQARAEVQFLEEFPRRGDNQYLPNIAALRLGNGGIYQYLAVIFAPVIFAHRQRAQFRDLGAVDFQAAAAYDLALVLD